MNFKNLLKKLLMPMFDVKKYQEINGDLNKMFSHHYENYGFKEGRPAFFFQDSTQDSSLASSLEIQYLRSEKLPNVFIVPEYFNNTPSPCSYIRLIFPLQYLEFLNEINLDKNTNSRKIWALNRTPNFSIDFNSWLASVSPNDRILYDIDDDLIFHYGPSSDECRTIVLMLLIADKVTVSTKPICEIVRKFNKKVTVRKNFCLHDLTSRHSDFDNQFSIFYMGTSTHNEDFKFIHDAITAVAYKYPNIKFKIVGVDALPKIDSIENLEITSSYYPQFIERYKNTGTYKLGIIPLIDNSINRSKSTIKYYDYLNKCEYILCSDVGGYKNLNLPRLYLVKKNNKTDWIRKIEEIINLPKVSEYEIQKSYNQAKVVKFRELKNLSKIINSLTLDGFYKHIDYNKFKDFFSENELYDLLVKRFSKGSGVILRSLDDNLNQLRLPNNAADYLLIDDLLLVDCSLKSIVNNQLKMNKNFCLILTVRDYCYGDFVKSKAGYKKQFKQSQHDHTELIHNLCGESEDLYNRLLSCFCSAHYKDNLHYINHLKRSKSYSSLSEIYFYKSRAFFISF